MLKYWEIYKYTEYIRHITCTALVWNQNTINLYLRSTLVHNINKFISAYPSESQSISCTKVWNAVIRLFCIEDKHQPLLKLLPFMQEEIWNSKLYSFQNFQVFVKSKKYQYKRWLTDRARFTSAFTLMCTPILS